MGNAEYMGAQNQICVNIKTHKTKFKKMSQVQKKEDTGCDPDNSICTETHRALLESGVREIRLQAELEIRAREVIKIRVPFNEVVECKNGGYTTWQWKK